MNTYIPYSLSTVNQDNIVPNPRRAPVAITLTKVGYGIDS